MGKIKRFIAARMVGKYSGPAVAWAVGATASYLSTQIATAPEWVSDLVASVLSAASNGSITNPSPEALTVLLTPVFASIVQSIAQAIQASGVKKVQENIGAKADGYAGPQTIDYSK